MQLLNFAGKMKELLKVLPGGLPGERSEFGVRRWHSIQQDDVMNQRFVGSYNSRQLGGGNFDGRFAFGARGDAPSLELGKKIPGRRPKTKLMRIADHPELTGVVLKIAGVV